MSGITNEFLICPVSRSFSCIIMTKMKLPKNIRVIIYCDIWWEKKASEQKSQVYWTITDRSPLQLYPVSVKSDRAGEI